MQMEATRSVASRIAAQRPEFSEILDRVRKLRAEIDSRALATEKARRVSAETMEALRDADVFRIMQPRRFGGYEYGPAELAQIGFELGRACGSTGWCGTLAVCFGWMTAFFPLEAQQEVWDDPDNLLAVSYTPTPKVEVVDGGYRISGSWPWASGVDSAKWLILAALIPGKDAPPSLAWCLVPASDVVVDHDSWNVSGARTSAEVVNDIFAKSGAAAADEKNRVQRFWRDANAAALHASIDWDTLSALYGTQQLGLQPQGVF